MCGVVIRTYDQPPDNWSDDLSLDDLIRWPTNMLTGLLLSPFLGRKLLIRDACSSRITENRPTFANSLFRCWHKFDVNIYSGERRWRETAWYLGLWWPNPSTCPSSKSNSDEADLWLLNWNWKASTDPHTSTRWLRAVGEACLTALQFPAFEPGAVSRG